MIVTSGWVTSLTVEIGLLSILMVRAEIFFQVGILNYYGTWIGFGRGGGLERSVNK